MKLQQSLKVSHSLNLTPTLTQAIRLLQLSHLDLLDEVSKVALENPFIEAEMPSHYWPTFLGDQTQDFYSNLQEAKTLEQHLLDQLMNFSTDQRLESLLKKVIYSMDEKGLVSEHFWEGICPDLTFKAKEILSELEPYGIGACSLQECFLWQMKRRSDLYDHPMYTRLFISLQDHYEILLQDRKKLLSILGLKAKDFTSLVELMKKLYSRPAVEYQSSSQHQSHIPDLITYEKDGLWHCALNEEALPRVSLYQLSDYKRQSNKEMKELTSQAKWFIKTLQTRHETLLTVGQAICEHQQLFFSQGKGALKPLILEDLAKVTGFHESTISRITTSKFILTSHGLYELKALLSRGLKTKNGDIASTASIKQLIEQMVRHEDPKSPLSDMKMAEILKLQGYQIARRTIAKYRELLQIGSSSERRK